MTQADSSNEVGIVGAGAFGTAMSVVVRRAGGRPLIWAYEPETAEAINREHANPAFLPEIPLDPAIRATNRLDDLSACPMVLMAPPAQQMRRLASALSGILAAGVPVVVCSKGLERDSAKLMSEVIGEELPDHPVAVLSGPNFAGEAARGLPSAATVAAEDSAVRDRVMAAVGVATFRPYGSADVIGAQIGGAVKNVLAIATGIVHGLDLGENARAALLTRGLAEMTRYGLARGAHRETLMGLSGLGDLILTCSSLQSRNMSLGDAIGRGGNAETIMAGRLSVAEGAFTAGVLAAEARRLAIDMPIVAAVDAILTGAAPLTDAVDDLLTRPFKPEET